MTSKSLSQAKKALRKQMQGIVSELSSTEIERQSRQVTNQVLKLPQYEDAKRIGIYLSMPKGEISTADIVREALLRGKEIFVPYIPKSSEATGSQAYMEMFALLSQEAVENLDRDAWGIPTLSEATLKDRENAMGGFGPSIDVDVGSNDVFGGLDLILLPGVAFDHQQGRLGHGKGFYDRYLRRYWEKKSRKGAHAKMPHLVGLALKQQLLPPEQPVPMSAEDWKVDQVIASS